MIITTTENIPVQITFDNKDYDKYFDEINGYETEKFVNEYLVHNGYVGSLDKFIYGGMSWSRKENIGSITGTLIRKRIL